MTFTAFVPARSGSKRLPNKNSRLLNGKPLFVWTLEACVYSSHIEQVIFSTDSMEYWETANHYIHTGKLVLDLRSQHQAGDQIKIFDYLKDNVDNIFPSDKGTFILALPTMPLRNTNHIDQAIDIYQTTGKPVFSASSYEFAVSFAFTGENGVHWEPVFPNSPMLTGNTRSQDQISMYHPNGAIYVREISSLKDPHLNTLYQDGVPMIMDRSESIDIDTELDFKIAEVMMLADD